MLHFLFTIVFLIICCYYLIQIVKINTVINYVKNGTIEIDSLWIIKSKRETINLRNRPEESLETDNNVFYKNLFSKIDLFMVNDMPWKDPSFSLDKLAKNVNSNTMYVSVAINKMKESNFKGYVNEFRLNAIVDEIKVKSNKNEMIILKEIYLNNGFNHQATFNKVFKTHFGKTPQEYINSI